MITLTCNQCQAHLEMDDAFAGGVCRCQYCGTIQHVPSQLKRRASHPGEQSGGATAPVATAAAVGVTPVAPPPPAAAGVALAWGRARAGAATPPAGPPAVPRASDDGLDALAEALGNGGPYRPSQAPAPAGA